MSKSIDEYRAKRDFSRTPEPAPVDAGTGRDRPVFVVHRHEARRLHYDLRLEMNGVLKSWAVPRGFNYDPKVKRLAVRTEDHPIEYERFEGVIPKGQYGAGTMTIWDRGHFELLNRDGAEGVERGKIEIRLFGRRLRGEWHLVKTKGAQGNEWIVFKSSRDRYARTEDAQPFGANLSLAKIKPFPKTIRIMKPGATSEPFSDPEWIFEMRFEGHRALALKRGDSVTLRTSSKKNLGARVPGLVEDLQKLRAENAVVDGVLVALDETGRPSVDRLDDVLATTREEEDTEVYLYVFDLLYYEEFDLRPLALIDRKAQLANILPRSPRLLYVDHVPASGASLADAVSASGLTGVIAKSTTGPYKAGRSDLWLEIPVDPETDSQARSIEEALKSTEGFGAPSETRIKFTNLRKVYWPQEGYTKGEVLAYYDQVADLLLPYLADRPCHMYRWPDGIEGESFYQREAPAHTPKWIETEPIVSDSKQRGVPHILCNDRATLLYLINLGSIDLHPWLSRRPTLDSPDWALLDLDAKQAEFVDVVKVARAIRKILDSIQLRGYLKTSGATGLHIYIPIAPGYSYDHSKLFCEGVARIVARELKDVATVERIPEARGRRVYVDFLQNRRSQTVVPPYAVRPVNGANVSMPLSWDELDFDLRPSQFNLRTALPRLSRTGDLFRGALDDPQDMMPAIEALQGYLRG